MVSCFVFIFAPQSYITLGIHLHCGILETLTNIWAQSTVQMATFLVSFQYLDIFHLTVLVVHFTVTFEFSNNGRAMRLRQTVVRDQSLANVRVLGNEVFYNSQVLVCVVRMKCSYHPNGWELKVTSPPVLYHLCDNRESEKRADYVFHLSSSRLSVSSRVVVKPREKGGCRLFNSLSQRTNFICDIWTFQTRHVLMPLDFFDWNLIQEVQLFVEHATLTFYKFLKQFVGKRF